MRFTRKHVKYPVAVLINISLIVILFLWVSHNVNLDQLRQDILSTHLYSLVLVVLLDVLVSLVYGLRLKLLLGSSFMPAWKSVCIGNGLNSLLPFRLGDVIRIYCAKRFYKIKVNEMLGATIVERCFDLFVLLLIGLVAFLLGPIPFGGTLVYVLLALFCMTVFVMLMYRALLSSDNALKRMICRSRLISNFLSCMSQILKKPNKKKVGVLSLLIWLGLVLVYGSFFKLNLLVYHFTWQNAMILCFITTLAFAVPYVVAGIGVFESAVIYYLIHVIGLTATKAMALALVFHFIYSIPQVLLMAGIFLLRRVQTLPLLRAQP